MVGKPHGRDFVWPHDIKRFVEALEYLMDQRHIEDLRDD